MASQMWILALVSMVCLQQVNAIKVMGIVSVPLKSHYMAFKPLFLELARKGHQVTVLSNYPNSSPIDNFKDVDLTNPNYVPHTLKPLESYDDIPVDLHNAENFYNHVKDTPHLAEDCENLFTNKNVKMLIESGERFDVIIVEQFMSDCGTVLAAVLYDGVPIIGITSHVLLPWTYPRIGLPFRYYSDAFYFSPGGQSASFFQKFQSILMGIYFNTIPNWRNQRKIQSIVEKYFPNNNVDVETVRKNLRMVFSYQHFSLTGARLLSPQVLEVGGMHVGKPKPLPSEIEDFINSSKHGVIYVSYGSNLKSSTLSKAKLKAFLEAFKDIPQRILWKFENVTVLEGHDISKIMTREWLPQHDILCHPKVVGFVSHGGLLGTSESISCAVPMVVTPFFGDQFANSASVKEIGLGIQLFHQDITKQTLLRALRDITCEKMQNRAKLLSQMWHDRPQSPLDSAVFWTEYVARYGSQSPPDLSSKNTTILEELLFNAYLMLAGVFLVLLGVVYILVKLTKYLVMLFARTVMCKRKKD